MAPNLRDKYENFVRLSISLALSCHIEFWGIGKDIEENEMADGLARVKSAKNRVLNDVENYKNGIGWTSDVSTSVWRLKEVQN